MFGEPPCAWRWPARLWTSILTSYSRPGDRILITDAGNGTAVRVGLSMDRQVSARVPSRTVRADLHLELLEEHPPAIQRQTFLFDDPSRHSVAAPSTTTGTGTDSSSRAGDRLAETPWPQQVLGDPVDLLIIPPPCPADEPRLLLNSYRASDDVAATDPPPGHAGTTGAQSTVRADGVGAQAETDQSPEPQDAVLASQLRLLTDRAALVRAGGLVVVLTRLTPSRDEAIDRLAPVIAHARSLGLRYLQHVPVLHADLREGRFRPGFGPDDPAWSLDNGDPDYLARWRELPPRHPLTSTGVGPTGNPHLHMPIHSDVLAFQVDVLPDSEHDDRSAGQDEKVSGGAQ
jgi:hypothetical protein